MTPKDVFFNRRQFLKGSVALSLLPQLSWAKDNVLTPTAQKLVSAHCNYYEFSTSKTVIPHLAKELSLSPWSISVSGLVNKPFTLPITSLASEFDLVNRTYPLRCVEGWVATIPWTGILLKDLLALAKPTANANYIRFIGTHRPSEMIGQRASNFDWPYQEALRLDEGLHPLTLLATGMYGGDLTPENGAPIRLVVPWKYGFKSIKAVTRIELVEAMPMTSWRKKAPQEYGFYANVNPSVAHPRWSQRRELPLGQVRKRATQPFNGFESEVEHLYEGMDLSVNF